MLLKKRILLTGGCGYIGSHTAISLLNKGFSIIIIDNLSNSKEFVIERIRKITGINDDRLIFKNCDLTNISSFENIFIEYYIYSVIHFACLKNVENSIKNPLNYYNNNINGIINLLEIMKKYHVNSIIFSSSATVYGNPKKLPVNENELKKPMNPCSNSISLIEDMLKDICFSNSNFSAIILRCFNPIGAHNSGLLGEFSKEKINNILPYIINIEIENYNKVSIFREKLSTNNNSTPDTQIKDYIDIMDLAEGHVCALKNLNKIVKNNFEIYNLGIGKEYTDLEIFNIIEKVLGKNISYQIVEKRIEDIDKIVENCEKAKNNINWKHIISIEDIDKIYANCEKAKNNLNWKPIISIEESCLNLWKFYLTNNNNWLEKVDVYVINGRNNRKELMKNKLNSLEIPFEFINGVSPEDNRIKKISQNNIHAAPCMFAHLDAISNFLNNSSKEFAIICEDDLKIIPSFKNDMEFILNNFINMKIDIMLLGYLIYENILYENIKNNFSKKNKYSFYDYHNNLWGAQMYMISKKYAKEIISTYTIDWTFKNTPFSSDWTITKNGNKCLVYPMLAIEDPNSPGNPEKLQKQLVYLDTMVNYNNYV